MREHEQIIAQVLKFESMLIQPFLAKIETKGEVSHIVIDGKFSHSVLKKAKEGDYRVQDDWGGTVHSYKPNAAEIECAENVARSCYPIPTYARVDLMWNDDGLLVLGELELIEPELWFRKNPKSADALALAIKKLISKNKANKEQ